MKYPAYYIIGILLFSACNSKHDSSVDEISGVQAILWTQYAAEVEALFVQGYNLASEIVMEYEANEDGLPPAVTLDIDETVLDNSPFSVEMIRQGSSYSEEKWAEWCERREAGALPGALAFTKLADSLGVEVFYVSNRNEELLEATLENLRTLNFPHADTAHVMLKTETSSKDARRARISSEFEIIVLIGDNLGDFDDIFDNRQVQYGKELVRENAGSFGRRYVILPNPMYGSWQRGIFPEAIPSEIEMLEKLRGYK